MSSHLVYLIWSSSSSSSLFVRSTTCSSCCLVILLTCCSEVNSLRGVMLEEEVAGLCASKVCTCLSLRLSDKFLLLRIKSGEDCGGGVVNSYGSFVGLLVVWGLGKNVGMSPSG